MTEWQPIDTAPKDGTEILLGGLYAKKKWTQSVGSRVGGYWMSNDGGDPEWSSILFFKPTHWLPLPAPPKKQESLSNMLMPGIEQIATVYEEQPDFRAFLMGDDAPPKKGDE